MFLPIYELFMEGFGDLFLKHWRLNDMDIELNMILYDTLRSWIFVKNPKFLQLYVVGLIISNYELC